MLKNFALLVINRNALHRGHHFRIKTVPLTSAHFSYTFPHTWVDVMTSGLDIIKKKNGRSKKQLNQFHGRKKRGFRA